MTDKELLELAAKAAGVGYADKDGKFVPFVPETWNPLTDDGQALRLAVKLGLEIGFPEQAIVWSFGNKGSVCREKYNDDPYAATRRAIVRAAAAIGETL